MNELTKELETAKRDFYMGLARDEIERELSPSPLADSRANIRSARALGKLSSAVMRDDVTLAEAIETAQLSPELGLQGGEVEWVIEKLIEEYAAQPETL